MLIVNTEEIKGYEIVETLGLVRGNIVQSKHVGKDIIASFRTIVGGEIKEYSEMMTEARQKATYAMVKEAENLGADAVVNVRYVSSQIMQGASELLAYGTAVRTRKLD